MPKLLFCVKKIELMIDQKQSDELEYVISKFDVPFYKNNLQSNAIDSDLIQYLIFSPDTTAREIMRDVKKILHTNQKDSLMAVHEIETAFSGHLDKMEDREDGKEAPKLREEFHALTEPAVKFRRDLLFMVIIAAAAALIGLFANNPSIIIGAMLVAPLLKPITAFSFNIAVFRPAKIITAGISILLLLGSIVGISALLTVVALQISPLEITDEIQIRAVTSPVFLILAVALGIAGALAMSSNVPGTLVGVAIAAALVPPASVIGIGFAMLDADILIGASILTLSNIIGLLLGTLTVFLIAGVTPKRYGQNRQIDVKYVVFIVSVLIGASGIAAWLSL